MAKRNRDKRNRAKHRRRLADAERKKAAMDNPKPKPTPKVELHPLFVTTQHEDGTYRYTLASRTSEFIAEIEKLFGPRNSSFTYVGLEIDETPDSKPKNWFPYSGIPSDEKGKRSRHVLIRLGENAMHNPKNAVWQLAHECVHLLDPWQIEVEDDRNPSIIEEGLCTWYQDYKVDGFEQTHDEFYSEAKSLVEPFMPDLADVVKHIRMQHQVRISAIDQEILLRHCPTMKPEVAERLCSPFEGY